MVSDSKYLWPPRCGLNFYSEREVLLFSSADRDLDLSDVLMLHWPHDERTVKLGLFSDSKDARWAFWTESNVKKMEDLIAYDLEFDGDCVELSRLTPIDILCAEEFRWNLRIGTGSLLV